VLSGQSEFTSSRSPPLPPQQTVQNTETHVHKITKVLVFSYGAWTY
jgi:hypothetical protein